MRSTYYQDSLVYSIHGRRQNEEYVLTIQVCVPITYVLTYLARYTVYVYSRNST